MDLEFLQCRAKIIQTLRNFFIERDYLELDTPALAKNLIPETCLEVFETTYLQPKNNKTEKFPLYLVPSPEIYIKPLIAQHHISVFQLSKCYRNYESTGKNHSPEFTMLEYYTMHKNYLDSLKLTEELITKTIETCCDFFQLEKEAFSYILPPYKKLTMNEAFEKYAGISLTKATKEQLIQKARSLSLVESQENSYENWGWDDLYELLLVHQVEPQLAKEGAVFLTDYPAQVPCLAKEKDNTKERWELYIQGVEIANCYSEETSPNEIKTYFQTEGKAKTEKALVPHAIDENYWLNFETFPDCSGVALGVDRLIMILLGQKTLNTVLPFSL